MCKKIEEIKNLTPIQIIEQYHRNSSYQMGKNSDFIMQILNKMGIEFQPAKLVKLETNLRLKNDTILGLAFSQGDDLKIVYSHTLDDINRNYVLAHELGHCCLHLPITTEFHVEMKRKTDFYFLFNKSFLSFLKTVNQKAKKEIEADEFAANLLIPTEKFLAYKKDNIGASNKDISDFFGVPENLVEVKNKIDLNC